MPRPSTIKSDKDKIGTLPIAMGSANIPQGPQKHSKFYFSDSLIAIRVENTLFNVHKSQLLKSGTFKDMFSLGKGVAAADDESRAISGEGSEDNPIELAGVRSDDFERLLTVLYTYHYTNEKPAEDASLLIPALRLANMWDFSELRGLLIPLAEKTLNDVEKIVHAREFGVAEWLVPAHVRLCQRDTSLTKEEATQVGFDSLLIISHLREKARASYTTQNSSGSYCYNCGRSRSSYPTYTTPDASYFQPYVQNWMDSNFERLE
ncbi:The BTB (BR-C, ttk and bab)/POZ (Pox virus and Zinc finger) domain [Ceratobasidium sp. AG-Ba]|nr:The BTB (BR-C, ttk and bab)/POZ (Pox virus and Zinc finger) domain [Ceratobasidium sp. AG-Ba]